MNPTNKKPPAARGVPQLFKQRETKSPQFKPVVAQLKTGVAAPNNNRPVAPPVYRPQPVPRVLQAKKSSAPKPTTGQTPRAPVAPPVYRPEARKLVQPKASSQLLKPLIAQRSVGPVIQRKKMSKFAAGAEDKIAERYFAELPEEEKPKAPPPPSAAELAQAEHEFFNLGAGQFSLEAKTGDVNSVINFATSNISGVLYSWLQAIDTSTRTFTKFTGTPHDSATTKRWVLDLPLDLSYVYEGGRVNHQVILDIHFGPGGPTGVGSCWVRGVGGQNSAVRSQECPALTRLYEVWLAGHNAERW